MVNAVKILHGIDGRWYNRPNYLLSVYFQFLTTGMSQPNTNICTSNNKKKCQPLLPWAGLFYFFSLVNKSYWRNWNHSSSHWFFLAFPIMTKLHALNLSPLNCSLCDLNLTLQLIWSNLCPSVNKSLRWLMVFRVSWLESSLRLFYHVP